MHGKVIHLALLFASSSPTRLVPAGNQAVRVGVGFIQNVAGPVVQQYPPFWGYTNLVLTVRIVVGTCIQARGPLGYIQVR